MCSLKLGWSAFYRRKLDWVDLDVQLVYIHCRHFLFIILFCIQSKHIGTNSVTHSFHIVLGFYFHSLSIDLQSNFSILPSLLAAAAHLI